MSQVMTKKPVKGGKVYFSKRTGAFVAVETDGAVSRKTPKSEAVAKSALTQRSAALERLKNR